MACTSAGVRRRNPTSTIVAVSERTIWWQNAEPLISRRSIGVSSTRCQLASWTIRTRLAGGWSPGTFGLRQKDVKSCSPMNEVVTGWAALSPVSDRCVYAGVAENSVYVHADHRGRGIGQILLAALIDRAEHAGIWTIQTGIFPENKASIALHERCGFRIVGRRERVGQLHGQWRDTLFLERRSDIAGL